MYARSTTEAGFTIVETMIFLAISGAMFFLAVSAIGGKQQQTEFQTGIDTLRAQLNLEMSNVNTGNYPTLGGGFVCSVSGGGAPNDSSATPAGTCDILGEIISFQQPSAGSNASTYTISPLFGRTYVGAPSGDVSTTIAEAQPILFPASANISQTEAMPFGLQIVPWSGETAQSIYKGGLIGAFGLISFTSFGGASGYNSVTGNLNSGSSHTEIFGMPGSSYKTGKVPSTGLTDLTSTCGAGNVCIVSTHPQAINPPSGITFCVISGTTNNESALFTIGGSNDPSGATYQVYTGATVC
jgi:hypothetical protein